MANNHEDDEETQEIAQEEVVSDGMVKIHPLKDFRIVANGLDIRIVEGEEIEVPEKFIQNLKTEGVI